MLTKRPLSPLQLRFCKEYALDPSSAKGAAIRAGYKIEQAPNVGPALLKDERVIKTVNEINNKVIKDMALTKERVLQELCLIAFANMKDYLKEDEEGSTYIDLPSLSRDVAAPLIEVQVDNIRSGKSKIKKVKIRQADKMAALEKLGKHLGLFTEKLEVSGQMSLVDLITQSMTKAVDNTAAPSIEDDSPEE